MDKALNIGFQIAISIIEDLCNVLIIFAHYSLTHTVLSIGSLLYFVFLVVCIGPRPLKDVNIKEKEGCYPYKKYSNNISKAYF